MIYHRCFKCSADKPEFQMEMIMASIEGAPIAPIWLCLNCLAFVKREAELNEMQVADNGLVVPKAYVEKETN